MKFSEIIEMEMVNILIIFSLQSYQQSNSEVLNNDKKQKAKNKYFWLP